MRDLAARATRRDSRRPPGAAMLGSREPPPRRPHRRAAVAGACTADIPSEDAASSGADALEWTGTPSPDLGDLELTVGSKSSAEQEILGWIAVEALRAAGADVQEEIALGSTVVIREAELAGLIDLYWEYTGTGWVELLRQTGPSSDPDELYDAVREVDEEENGIEWLSPPPRTADTRS